MTERYRGPQEEQTGMSRWFRQRWEYGSVYVLDIDRVCCKPDLSMGLLIEEKHERAVDRNWRVTASIAQRLGWYAALFVYATDDGTPYGTVTRIDVTWQSTDGSQHEIGPMDQSSFDEWANRTLGAVRHEVAA